MRHWTVIIIISVLAAACVVIVAKEGQEDKPLINLLRKHMGLD